MSTAKPVEMSVTRRNGMFRLVFSPLEIDEWCDEQQLKAMVLHIGRSEVDFRDRLRILRMIHHQIAEWADEKREEEKDSASLWLVDGFFLIMTFVAGFALGGVVL